MDCKQCAEDLTAFLDGELKPADSEQVRHHLRACISCSEELASPREAADFVESHRRNLEPRPESLNLLRARIHDLNATPVSRFSLFGRLRWALAAMAVLAIFTFGYIQYQQIQQKNLEMYISRYERERQLRIIQLQTIGNPYQGNPFIEVKATVFENPFRAEGR